MKMLKAPIYTNISTRDITTYTHLCEYHLIFYSPVHKINTNLAITAAVVTSSFTYIGDIAVMTTTPAIGVFHCSERRSPFTLTVTVTEALVLRPLLEDRGRITVSIRILVPVDRMKQKCVQITTKRVH